MSSEKSVSIGSGNHRTTSRLNRNGLPSGTKAPSFALPDLEGILHNLDHWSGCRILLLFSDPDCEPCTQVIQRLQTLELEAGLSVVMVSRGDAERNRAKALELGVTFPVLLQKKWEISLRYGIFMTPVAYLIDEIGVLSSDVAIGVEAIINIAKEKAHRRDC